MCDFVAGVKTKSLFSDAIRLVQSVQLRSAFKAIRSIKKNPYKRNTKREKSRIEEVSITEQNSRSIVEEKQSRLLLAENYVKKEIARKVLCALWHKALFKKRRAFSLWKTFSNNLPQQKNAKIRSQEENDCIGFII